MTEPNLSGLYRILEMMGASTFKGMLETPEGIQLEAKNIIFRNGIPYIIDEKTGTEYQTTIHIKNHDDLSKDEIITQFENFRINRIWQREEQQEEKSKESKRIHLGKCKTIERMIEREEFFKYHGNQRKDHIRQALANDGECNVPLFVCKNCIEKFNIAKIFIRKQKIAKNFDFVGWFNKTKSTGRLFDDVQSDTAPADAYPKNWHTISREYRAKANWTCECCRVNLHNIKYLLDAHHISKRKSDCSDENLKALCKLCHAKQPYHGHMGHREDTQPYIEELRQQQGLERYCPNCGS